MDKTHTEIEKKLLKAKGGSIFFLSDFRGTGTEGAIKMALSRLTKDKKVKRIAHGIYLVPKIDPLIGEVLPSMESIAYAIAEKDRVHIKPAGAFALHKLGLSTQVPMKLVYLTDGALKQLKIGKTTIKFKPTTAKKLSLKGPLSSLIIQALEELGTEHIEDTTKKRIKELLHKEDKKKLLSDMKLAPAKVSDYLFLLLKEQI